MKQQRCRPYRCSWGNQGGMQGRAGAGGCNGGARAAWHRGCPGRWAGSHPMSSLPDHLPKLLLQPKAGGTVVPQALQPPLLGQVSPPASSLPLFPFPRVFSGRGFLVSALIPRPNTNHCRLPRGRKYFCSEYFPDPPLHGNGHYHYWWVSLSFQRLSSGNALSY